MTKLSRRGPGRPPSGRPLRVRLVCYVAPDIAAAAKSSAERDGDPSVSAWVSRVVTAASRRLP